MKKSILFSAIAFLFVSAIGIGQTSTKLVSTKTHIKFFSTTPAENIEANNTTAVSTISKESGDVVFSVPMQGFEFEKSLMQKHFNSDKFLDTKTFPKAKLKAKITNLDQINFEKDGTYTANIEGELTIKGTTNPIKETGIITVKNGIIEVKSTFSITLSAYKIEFVKGKPSSNIAKTVEITVHSEYQPE